MHKTPPKCLVSIFIYLYELPAFFPISVLRLRLKNIELEEPNRGDIFQSNKPGPSEK